MPLMQCQVNGKSGWKYGESGHCYTGDGARAKAARQGRAIEANKNMELLTANFDGQVQYRKLEGRDYMVVPVVMLVEGVHNGSEGPMFYPAAELAKRAAVWNHKPVVVYHPGAGQATASTPEFLTERKVGIVLNAESIGNGSKLRAEAWIEIARAKSVDLRVYNAVRNGNQVEVSTGVFVDRERRDHEATWNTETYSIIARNLGPDHLAILPDKKGACSGDDGCGLLRNGCGDECDCDHCTQNREKQMAKEKIVDGLIANKNTKWEAGDKEFLLTLEEDQLKKFEVDPPSEGTLKNSTKEYLTKVVKLSEDKAELVMNNLKEGYDDEETKKKKKQKEKMEKMQAYINDAPEEFRDFLKEQIKVVTPPTGNQTPPSLDEFINNAPAELRDVLRQGISAHNEQKEKLIGVITANKANKFSVEQLRAKEVAELQGLAALARSTMPAGTGGADYSGQAGFDTPTENQHKESPMSVPITNYAKEKSA